MFEKVLTKHINIPESQKIDYYEKIDGYKSWRKVLKEMTSDQVIHLRVQHQFHLPVRRSIMLWYNSISSLAARLIDICSLRLSFMIAAAALLILSVSVK